VSLGLELLEEELTTDTSSRAKGYSESVTQIKSAAAIAVDVLNDLLQYEKMKDNTLQMFRAVHPATDVVTEVLETFKIQVQYTINCDTL
jgi:signal transduction histidine kinase